MTEEQVNAQDIINSLSERLMYTNIEAANKDAVIIAKNKRLEELEKTVEDLRKQLVDEMDEGVK